jgi:type 1 glutamine amidotransferase
MYRDGKAMSLIARTAIAAALLACGGFSTPLLADDDDHARGTSSGMRPDLNDPKISGDFDYGVCRGTDPKCYHDWVVDENGVSGRQNKVLLYTRTAGPRHANLGPALPPGKHSKPYAALTAAHVLQQAIIRWMAAEGVDVDVTEDVTQINNLNQYRAVIFASTSRDTLWKHGTAISPTAAVNTTTNAYLDSAKVALRQYMRAGGGFVAIHNAFGTEYNWPYYEGLLGNANYYDHGQFQDGTAVTIARDPSTDGLPPRWDFRDEWYNLVPFPTKVKFLVLVDENTLATKRSTHPGHGKFHPVAWCQYYDGGRAWLTTLGHDRGAFTEGSGFPSQALFQRFITQGIKSAMGMTPFCTGDRSGKDRD